MRFTDSICFDAKSRRAMRFQSVISSLNRDQIRPHPAAESLDAEPHGRGLGNVFDGDDLVVDERFERRAQDLLVLPGPGEIRREDGGALLLDGLGEMAQQREGRLVLLDLLVQQVELRTAPGVLDDVSERLVDERAVDPRNATEHPAFENPMTEELQPERVTAGQEQDPLLRGLVEVQPAVTSIDDRHRRRFFERPERDDLEEPSEIDVLDRLELEERRAAGDDDAQPHRLVLAQRLDEAEERLVLRLDQRLRDLLTLVEEQDGLLVAASVLLQGVHEQPPLIDDGTRGLGFAVRPPDAIRLRLARVVRELGQELLRDVLVLLEAFLPETAEIEPQHGGGLVLSDVTGDALERQRRLAGALQSLDGDGPWRISDQGTPDDFQLTAPSVEGFARDGVGVLVRAVGHGAGRRACRCRRAARRLRRARLRRGRCRRGGFRLGRGSWNHWPCQRGQRGRIDALELQALRERQDRRLVELHVTVFGRRVDLPREFLEMLHHLVGADEDLEIRMHRYARRWARVRNRHDGEDLELGLLVEEDIGEITREEAIALQQEVVGDAIALLAGLEDGIVELAAVG